MTDKVSNSTIEVWCHRVTHEPPRAALVFKGWYSAGWADNADQHFRCISPDGELWHVLVFDGMIPDEEARRLVHVVYDGHVKKIDLERGGYA